MSDPPGAERAYRRAGALAAEGRLEEARAEYLAAVTADPNHFGALTDFANLLYATDFRTAARTLYAHAARLRPDEPIARINLGNALLADGAIEPARAEFDAALHLAPDHPDAHQGLANLLQEIGEAEAAEAHRRRSYAGRRIVTPAPRPGDASRTRVLVLVSAAGGNVPTRFLLDPSTFVTPTVVVEAWRPGDDLPPHDLVFNAVGDADRATEALDAAEAVLACSEAPVVNAPDRVRRTGRAENASRLGAIPGVVTPRTVLSTRADLAATAQAIGYPLLVRSPGHHTGRFFARIDAAPALEATVAELPGDPILVMDYLDAGDAAGWTRKYRAMIVGGALFPLHLAIARDWKVHWFTAAMADQPAHRAEEHAFLADMPAVLGPLAMQALAGVAATLGLDYAGVDFALGPAGEVLLFETNATMVVNPPDPDPLWDYRRAPVQRVLAATRTMLLARAASGVFTRATPRSDLPG